MAGTKSRKSRPRLIPQPSANGKAHADSDSTGGETLEMVSAAEVVHVDRQWLSPGRVPLGCLWLLDGNKGSGKSSLAAAIAAAVTGGPALPGGRKHRWGSVLWFAGEEDLTDVKGKLRAAKADLGRVHFPGRTATGETLAPFAIGVMEDMLDATVRAARARLVIFDTLACFAGSADLNQEQPARSVTSPLTRIAQATGALILAIRHPRKTPVANPLDRGMGSPAIAAAARGVMTTGKDPETGSRVLGVLVTNTGRVAPTITYDLVDKDGFPALKWGQEIDLPAERIEFGMVEEGSDLLRLEAKQLLRKRVGTQWVPAADVLAEARKNGIGQDALDRARWRLGVRSRRVGKIGSDGHWEYGPPEAGWPKDL